jgi:hypothetical protein
MKMMDFIDAYGTVGLAQLLPHGAVLQSNANVFFVGSTLGQDASGYGNSWETPFATIDYAIGECTGVSNDVILLDPTHSESITAAGAITCDKARVSIIGLGTGSARPIINYTTAAGASIEITAANVTLKNIRLQAVFTNGVTSAINITATGDYATLDGLTFRDTLTTQEFLICVTLTAAAADNVTIQNCDIIGLVGTASAAIVATAGIVDNLRIINNRIIGTYSTAALELGASAIHHTYLYIEGNKIYNETATAAVGVTVDEGCTGAFCLNNYVRGLGTGASVSEIATIATGGQFENYCSGETVKSGIISPAIDALA